ncbi:MAG TPA: YceI family protein [Steroidobacteraceae bacterium]|nr:YceI family protein [Steroidobacteraceae bacterium]
MKTALFSIGLVLAVGGAWAAPETYTIDPTHTYPSFEADHMGGMSVWRGKFKTSSGTVTLDTAAQTGAVDITIDPASIDFGMDALDAEAKGPDLFDVAKYPTATYKGKLADFRNGAPTAVIGEFTLHGVTRPLTLTIRSFKCAPNPMTKKQTCGADAVATFNRADYNMDYGRAFGFRMGVNLAIQVEAWKN